MTGACFPGKQLNPIRRTLLREFSGFIASLNHPVARPRRAGMALNSLTDVVLKTQRPFYKFISCEMIAIPHDGRPLPIQAETGTIGPRFTQAAHEAAHDLAVIRPPGSKTGPTFSESFPLHGSSETDSEMEFLFIFPGGKRCGKALCRKSIIDSIAQWRDTISQEKSNGNLR